MKINKVLIKALVISALTLIISTGLTAAVKADHFKVGSQVAVKGFCFDEKSTEGLSIAVAMQGKAGYRGIMEDENSGCFSAKSHSQLPWEGFSVRFTKKLWTITPLDLDYDFQVWVGTADGYEYWTWTTIKDHGVKPATKPAKSTFKRGAEMWGGGNLVASNEPMIEGTRDLHLAGITINKSRMLCKNQEDAWTLSEKMRTKGVAGYRAILMSSKLDCTDSRVNTEVPKFRAIMTGKLEWASTAKTVDGSDYPVGWYSGQHKGKKVWFYGPAPIAVISPTK